MNYISYKNYVNNLSYVSNISYVNNMSYVNYMSIFINHLKSNNFVHNLGMYLRHPKYEN